jgi:hypothetical protein
MLDLVRRVRRAVFQAGNTAIRIVGRLPLVIRDFLVLARLVEATQFFVGRILDACLGCQAEI